MKLIGLLLIIFTLPACGTITVISADESKIRSNLSKINTNCSSITRAYGGVSYDFCQIHSNPNTTLFYNWFVGFYLIDIIPSAVLDTIILPYTVNEQIKNGNMNTGKR